MNRIVVSIRRSIFLALVCLSFIWLFPEPAEASCYFSWTCPKCAQAGRGTQTRDTAGPYASSSSCQAARSSASAPGMRIGGCSCSSSYKRSTRKRARKITQVTPPHLFVAFIWFCRRNVRCDGTRAWGGDRPMAIRRR